MNEADLRRRAGRNCSCGYLETSAAPARLCFDCGDRALADWLTEEKALLGRMPGYATAVTEVLRDTAQRQEKAIRARSNEPNAEAQWERNKGGKRLSAIRRTHRADAAAVVQDRWAELASLVQRDPREQLRKDAKRFTKRGLGAAGLTALGLEAAQVLFKRLDSGR